MFTRRKPELVTALITAAGLIALAFFKHYMPIHVSPETFFYAAAAICLLPVFYAVIRCKAFRGKRANVS
jgi:hypothetical protein